MAIAKLVVVASICGYIVLSQAAGCSRTNHDGGQDHLFDVGQDELTKSLGGDEVVAILRQPDKVTAALLVLPDDYDKITPDRFPLASSELSVSSEAAAKVANAIINSETNLQSDPKTCTPSYECRFTFIAGKNRVDLYLCFLCDMLAVYLNGKEAGGSHFDNIHHTLIREAISLFPDNAELRELATEE